MFSHGFLCPKGSTLKQLHDDPDRVRRPLVKRDGVHVEVEWDEAWAVIADRLPAIIARHGRESVGVYLGNPSAHSLSALLYNRSLLQALGTRRRFSASTVDQMPRQVAAGYVFGTPVTVPVPDLDHTDYLVIMGANPYASNGSLCTAPDFPGRIEAIRARGGTVVVVDPRRSRTAEEADRWLPIRPGTDALLLAAMVTTLAAGGPASPRATTSPPHLSGLDEVVAALAPFTARGGRRGHRARPPPRSAAGPRAVAAPPAAACTAASAPPPAAPRFGTITSWLIDVVNIVTGNLDRRGGAMFPMPVAGGADDPWQAGVGQGRSRSAAGTPVRASCPR